MLKKAAGLCPDVFVPDLEDSVPLGEKDNARTIAASSLQSLSVAHSIVIPRVNSLDTGLLEKDVEALIGPHTYGVSVGKIHTGRDIEAIDQILVNVERSKGISIGSSKLIPWIESASGIVNAYEICSASTRIVGVAFGAEDYTNDMRIERRDDESETAFARNVVCVAARAADVLAIDSPYFRFLDGPGLRVNALAAKKIGFTGKFAIHPSQIEIIREIFSPSVTEINHSKLVVKAFKDAEQRGRGSVSLDGRVIDVPVYKRALNLLIRAGVLLEGED